MPLLNALIQTVLPNPHSATMNNELMARALQQRMLINGILKFLSSGFGIAGSIWVLSWLRRGDKSTEQEACVVREPRDGSRAPQP